MTFRIEVSTTVDRPVSDVFDFYAVHHVQNHPRWDPDISLEQISEGPIDVGTVIRRENTRSGSLVEGTMEVVEFEPNSAFGLLIREGSTLIRGRADFQEIDEGSCSITIEAEFEGVDDSLRDFIAPLMQRSADNIKALIESEPS